MDFVTPLMFQVSTKNYSGDKNVGQGRTSTEHYDTHRLTPHGFPTSNNLCFLYVLPQARGTVPNHNDIATIRSRDDTGCVSLLLYIDTHGLAFPKDTFRDASNVHLWNADAYCCKHDTL